MSQLLRHIILFTTISSGLIPSCLLAAEAPPPVPVFSSMTSSPPLVGVNYNIEIRYGTSTFSIRNSTAQPINLQSLTFYYAGSQENLNLPPYGPFNTDNLTVTAQPVGNTLLKQYTLTFKKPIAIPASGEISLGQIKLGEFTQAHQPLTTPTPDYQGFIYNVSAVTDKGSFVILPKDACQGGECQDPVPGNRMLGGYYANWTVYTGHGGYDPATIPVKNLNTIFYAIGKFDPSTGNVGMLDTWADFGVPQHPIPAAVLARQRYPYLNLIYSFGGWGCVACGNYPSGDLSVLFVYYPDKIATVAKNMVNSMLQAGFNGIDIDYEWIGPFQPKPPGGQLPLAVKDTDPHFPDGYSSIPLSQKEADGFAQLIYDLRQDLNQLPPPPAGQSNYKLTVALFSGVDKINELNSFKNANFHNESDLKIIVDNVDYADLMTYDFHGSWDAGFNSDPDSISNFHSQFAVGTDDPTKNPVVRQYNVVDALKALINADPNDPLFPLSKITIGVPAYSRITRLSAPPQHPTPAQQVGLFNPLATTDQQAKQNTDVAGEFTGDYAYQTLNGGGGATLGSTIFDYKCILQFPNPSSLCYFSGNPGSRPMPADMHLYAMDALSPSGPGAAQATPWAYGPTSRTFMSFDNNLSAAKKAQFVLDQKLGGLMIWELDGDLAPTDPLYVSKSLIYSMYRVLAQR